MDPAEAHSATIPAEGRGANFRREVVRRVVNEGGHEAGAVRQSATVPLGDFEAQLCNAGVLLRQGLGHSNSAREEPVRRGLLGAGRETGRRLEQAQAEALLLPFCLQRGNRAAEYNNLGLEAIVELGAGLERRCGLAGR